MPEATPLSPELSRSVSALARALMAAGRTWMLYPPDHPAVRTAVEQFERTVGGVCGGHPFAIGVTPDSLLLQGEPAGLTGGPVGEAAAWLHARDILQLTVHPGVAATALEALLALLAEDPRAVRARGGPATAWQALGHPDILIEQLDFARVLEDGPAPGAVRAKDQLWRAIVRKIVDRRTSLDTDGQALLLEIAGDAVAVGDLARDVMAPHCTPDGSPLLTSQAAAIVAAYQHLVSSVEVLAPERRQEVLRNLATATAALDPRVAMQVVAATGAATGSIDLRRAVAGAMNDGHVAQLLATTLALDGQATGRLASVFSTIAPDDDRRRRVLTMTRRLLGESSFGQGTGFQALWTAMEEMLLSYDERPAVSSDYRDSLDRIGARAEAMAGEDIPPELAALIDTLDQDNVRRLSVALLIDLLALERDAASAADTARDVAALGEDLLLAGDFVSANTVAAALARHAADRTSVAAAGARLGLEAMIATAAFHEAAADLGDMDEPTAAIFAETCAAAGPPVIDALRRLLEIEATTPGRRRAAAIVTRFGAAGVKRLAPLIDSPHWHARRNAAEILGQLACPDAVPLLQPLLRGSDARVTQAAVAALSRIDDPSAGRAVHTVLRAAAGDLRRAVVGALVAERDPRVVPLLTRILDESDALGTDHAIVMETLAAVATLGREEAIPAVDRVMRRTRWFARGKRRALKTAAVEALARMGTPAAAAALTRAAASGDRLLRQAAARAGHA